MAAASPLPPNKSSRHFERSEASEKSFVLMLPAKIRNSYLTLTGLHCQVVGNLTALKICQC